MISKKIIVEVFGIFTTDYRNQWSQSVSSDMWPAIIKRWQDGLSKFDDEVILEATKHVFKYFPTHPPTLGQFYELCKRFKKDGEVLKMEKIDWKPIDSGEQPEKKEGEEPIAERCLREMREAIANARPYPCRKAT